jgi:HD superfamily phosphohydrolase
MHRSPSRNWVKFFEKKTNEVVERWLPNTYNPQKIRDNKVFRDALWGFNLYYKHEIPIIDSPLFQRLRRIRQTSLAQYTYPSATHTRFEHSLGTAALVERILTSLQKRLKESAGAPIEKIDDTQWIEARLAALLHDIGHGPFSHGSEEYFKRHPAFRALEDQAPELFKERAPTEILAYFIVKSRAFERFWKKIISHYPEKNLHLVTLDRVAKMIIGQPPTPQDSYLAQIINGPFDVDKLDYLPRDGYYTGLHLDIDVDRLLLTMVLWRASQGAPCVLAIDFSGVSALEQLLFTKMVIFTSVYHHHKVRSSLHSLFRIFDFIIENEITINGVPLADPQFKNEMGKPYPNPFNFLLLDDQDLLCSHLVSKKISKSKRLNQLIADLNSRKFLKRALVLSIGALEKDGSLGEFANLQDPNNLHLVQQIRQDIASASGQSINDIIIDIPSPPRFEAIAKEAHIKLSELRSVELEEAFPTRGWVTAYSAVRNRVYILCSEDVKARVGRHAVNVLKQHRISVKSEALEHAKQDSNIVMSIFPTLPP